MGFVNFILMGYHFKAKAIMSDAQIPFIYAIAMAVDAVAAIAIGKTYDIFKVRHKTDSGGLLTLIVIPVLSAVIPFFAFSVSMPMVITSAVLWGIVMGAHETVMKSAIADLTPIKKRGTGYGIFNTGYGLAAFFGSTAMGFLYDISIAAVIGLTVVLQIAGIFVFIEMQKEVRYAKARA